MARKRKESKIYHPLWKKEILEEIKKVAEITEREFKVSERFTTTNTYIDGYLDVSIRDELDNERFRIEDETDLVFTNVAASKDSDTPLRYNNILKNILPPKYLMGASISQKLIKLPLNGEIVVQSNRGKKYPVKLASYCEYNMEELLNAKTEDLPIAHIDTKQDPWVCVQIEVEKKEKSKPEKGRSIFDNVVSLAYEG